MSTAQVPVIRPAQPRPESRSAPREDPRRRFVIVPSRTQRRRRPRILHALVAVGGVLVIVGAQLLLSIAISGGAYSLSRLQGEQRSLQRESAALAEQVQVLSSTQYLAKAADKLGMIPARNSFFLDLTTGKSKRAPGVSNVDGCGGDCNLAKNVLIKGIPLPSAHAPADAAAAAAAATDAVDSAAGGTKRTPADAKPAKDPNAPVVADTLPGVVTH